MPDIDIRFPENMSCSTAFTGVRSRSYRLPWCLVQEAVKRYVETHPLYRVVGDGPTEWGYEWDDGDRGGVVITVTESKTQTAPAEGE